MARRQDLQRSLYEDQAPARAGNPLFCHQDFLEKMGENRANTVGRRAALLLHRLLVDIRRQYYKTTRGENRGWRRSPLGGSHGSHFYAWWAPQGAAPLRSIPEFEDAPAGAVFLRDIRHHDDHRALNPQSLADSYLPIGVKDLRQEDYVPAPWTTAQTRFAQARQKIRIIKGHPGSGKTTALWHAADLSARESVLYITYSPELAALARDHFDKFEPRDKRFQVITYARLLRELLASELPFEPLAASRNAFIKEISGFSATILGPWLNEKGALYDELHAHLFGAMLPVPIGRFPGFPDRRITARQYRDLRERAIGRPAAEAAFEVAETLRRRSSEPLEPRFFRELDLAWQAVAKLRSQGAGPFANFDCVAIDEVQDLTPIESLALVELAVAMGGGASVLAAGDEAQTVRPTDFEWGWFQDLLHFRLASPVDFKLQANLRSPRRIADLVNRVWDLYAAIEKRERPSGTGEAEIDVNSGDQVLLCAGKPGPEVDELLRAFSQREGLALIALGDEVPAYVPEALRPNVLTTFEAKGLDFQSVCVLEAGKWLDRIVTVREQGRGLELESLSKRLAIDQLRVALSRPSERLYWLDVGASERTLERARRMLSWGDLACAMSPAALLKTLEEESLDPEERVLLCEADARQLLAVRPALAWSRAKQAVALLGEPAGAFAVTDPAARNSARMTLCQTAFTLAFRKIDLPAELGRLNLYEEAAQAAFDAGRVALPVVIRAIAAHERDTSADRTASLVNVAVQLADHEADIDPWLVELLHGRSVFWLSTLELRVDQTPLVIYRCLPKLYRIFVPAEAPWRTARLRGKTIQALIRLGFHADALRILLQTPGADPKLIAECREGLGEFELAAIEYLKAGSPKDALRCYRSMPDFDKALELLQGMPDHPARASMDWLRRMRDLAAERPEEFSKTILPGEKKLLEQILEASLGATRKKAAAKTAPKAAAKAAPKTKKPPPAKRPLKPKPRKKPEDNPYF
jgi:tetratricopeptide (TPR) repeat protein